MSLDGYVAGPDQGADHPLGVGGERLHAWMRELEVWRRAAGYEGGVTNANTEVFERADDGVTALVMGRNMFGGGPGPWSADPPWNGWWGDDPPFHMPVFVLTHHAREPLVMQGGTTFTFVTDGLESALEQARAAANGGDVAIGGGAGTARQFISAGLVDRLLIHQVPALLGGGVRLFDDPALATLRLEQDEVFVGPGVTHLGYRVVR